MWVPCDRITALVSSALPLVTVPPPSRAMAPAAVAAMVAKFCTLSDGGVAPDDEIALPDVGGDADDGRRQ